MKKRVLLLFAHLTMIFCFVHAQSSYTWIGASGASFQTSTSWSPTRTTPALNDVLQFTSNATVTNVPTQTIGQLILSGSSTVVSLQAATGGSRTLTIGNGNVSGTDLDIPSGCSLTMATGTASNDALTIAFTGTPTASIAGSLVINASFTGQYTNTYIATNSTTTVSGTVTNTGAITSSATNLVFASGSNYIHNRPDGTVAQAFPVANFTNANVTVQALVNSSATPAFTNFPSAMASLTWNTPLVTSTGGSRWTLVSGTSLTITGNVSITQGASTTSIAFSGSSANSVNIGGNLTVTGTTLFTGRGTMNWTVTGDFTLNNNGATTLISGFYSGTGSVTSTMTVGNLTQNGGTFTLNGISAVATGASTGKLVVKGNFNKAAGTFTTGTTVSTSATAPGAQVGTIELSGTTAQTFTLTGGFTNSPNLTINNSNGVTLGSAVSLQNSSILTLTSGKLVLDSYNLTMGSGASISPSTPTSASYINASGNGLLIRQSVPSSGNTVFPVGTATSYAPLIFTGGTAGRDITVGVKGSFTNSVPYPDNVVNLQWSILASASTQPTVTFQYNTANQGSGYISSGAVLGINASGAYTETALSSVSGANPYTTSISLALPTSGASLYGIGNPSSFLVNLGIPTGVTATAGTASASVSFTPPAITTGITGYRVVSSPGSFTASGTTSPIVITGLNSGTPYTFTVQATDGTYFGTTSTISNSVTPTGNYSWTGSTSNDYQVATNWSPNRTTAGTGDVLTFSSNATVTNVPTQTIGQLLLSGSSTAVSLQATTGGSRTLTIGNGNLSGTDLDIPSGCSLTLATGVASNDALTIAFTGTPTASIAGSMVINASFTSQYLNTYIATNSTTTVSGTITNTGAITSAASNLVFASGSNYIHNRPDGDVAQVFPIANFTNANVTVQALVNTSTTTTTGFSNFPSAMASLTWNTPLVTGTAGTRWTIVSGGASLAITGNVSITQGGSGVGIGFSGGTATSVNIGGNLTVTTASLIIGRGAMDWTVTGDLTLNNNSAITVLSNFYSGTGSVTATMTVGNFTQNGGTFTLNGISAVATGASIGKLVVKGNFNKAAGTFTTGTIVSTSGTAPGAQVGTLELNGTTAQTFTLTGGFTNSPNLTINNSNGVTLATSVSLQNSSILTLTSGKLVLGSNNLTLGSTASISPGTPTSASYIDASGNGLLIRQSVPSSGNTVFPVGTATSYAPLIFTGGTAGADITVGVKGSFTNAVVVPNNVVNLQWSILASAATQPSVTFQYNSANRGSGFSSSGAVLGTYNGTYSEDPLSSVTGTNPFTTTVAFTSDLPTVSASFYGIGNANSFVLPLGIPTSVVAVAGNASATVSFSLPSITTGITGYRVVSNPGGFSASGTTSPLIVTGLQGGTAYTFTVQATDGTDFGTPSSASNSVTPTGNYTWTGTTSTNYQVAGNWSPSRITPGTSDVLTFSGNATVINVPTQTIGQLILSGSTTVVSLQPAIANGNRILTIGNSNTSDNDLQIPTGCELIIASNSHGTITLPATYGGGANDRDKISNALTVQLASANTPKASIVGKLTIQRNATYKLTSAPALFANNTAYTAGTYVYRNQNLYAVTTGGTTNTTNPTQITFGGTATSGTAVLTYIGSVISGSINSNTQYGVFGNTYNLGGGATTVTASGTIENQSASIGGTISSSSLLFSSGASYVYNRPDGNTNLPVATDMSGVNITVKGIVSSYFINTITLPTVSASLTWNNPSITVTGGSRFTVPSGTSLTINGNASITQGHDTTTFILVSGSAINSINIGGNLTIDKVHLPLARGTMNLTVVGTLTMSSASALSVIDNFYTGTGNVTSTLTVGNFVQNGGTFILNNINTPATGASVGKFVIKGNFNNIAGIFTTGSTISTSGTNPGAQVGLVEFSGTSAQTISGVATTNNLTLNNSAGATITSGMMNVTGSLTLSSGNLTANGNLTLQSTATTQAYVAGVGINGNTGTITGNVVVERYIPKGKRAFRDIAPGVAPSTTVFNSWQEGGAFTAGYGTYITGLAATKTFTEAKSAIGFVDGTSGLDLTASGSKSMFTYNNTTGVWDTVTNTKTLTLNGYRGYRVLVRGDRNWSMYLIPQAANMINATTLRSTGTLLTGNQTGFTLNADATGTGSNSKGFSLVGNPYVSPIDWNTIVAANRATNLSSTIWYLNPKTVGYVTYSQATGLTSPSGNNYGRYIQPGQGFFVRTTAASPSLTITEADKEITQTADVFGSEATSAQQVLRIGLYKPVEGITTSMVDETVAVFGKFSNTVNGDDSYKMENSADNIALLNSGNKLAIEARSAVSANDVLPVSLNKLSNGTNYQLKVDASGYNSNGFDVYVKDAYKQTETAVKAGSESVVDFTIDNAVSASFNNRFSLVFKPSVLPISSIDVQGVQQGSDVVLSINTVGESNIGTYTVEKSTDGVGYSVIATVAAKNTATASYGVTDNKAVSGNNYYRVKVNGLNEASTYSKVVVVKVGGSAAKYALYPNPSNGSQVGVQLTGVSAGKYTVTLRNMLGQEVRRAVVAHVGGNGQLSIKLASKLSSGSYTVSVLGATATPLYQGKLVVE